MSCLPKVLAFSLLYHSYDLLVCFEKRDQQMPSVASIGDNFSFMQSFPSYRSDSACLVKAQDNAEATLKLHINTGKDKIIIESAKFSTKGVISQMAKKTAKDLFIDRRVAIDPVPLSGKKKGTIMYKGLLSMSGADSIYLYSGYDEHWANASLTPMTKIDDTTWSTDVTIDSDKKFFNFCFKDGADHWDNNSGLNWGVTIV
ncbi:MAG TPA: hypothetical protein DEQ54_01690 [Firmicutes bacterium]|jgi:hypothetical protein|nr:hypothetical protein [Bacillota bacterium]